MTIPMVMLSSEHTSVSCCSGLSLKGARWRHTVLGKIQHLFRAITPEITVRGRDKMFHSPPKMMLEFLQNSRYWPWSGNCSQLEFTHVFPLPHFHVPISRVVTRAGTVNQEVLGSPPGGTRDGTCLSLGRTCLILD